MGGSLWGFKAMRQVNAETFYETRSNECKSTNQKSCWASAMMRPSGSRR
jgi:hypothetical protein